MEKVVEIDVWSDDWAGNNIINVLHDIGIKTAGMHTEINGTFESKVEWERCKSGEIPSLCVCLKGDAMKSIAENVHETKDVEEKPLFLYKLHIIDDVPDKPDDDDVENTTEKEKEMNVVMNIGLTTQDGKELDMDTVINMVGLFADCTITPTIGFYKGVRENSIKVEIYGYTPTAAFELAAHFARSFNQECIALTVNEYTAFISQHPTNDEYKEFVARVDK